MASETSNATNQDGYGLKEDWRSVEDTLRQIIPVYDKTNRYISLGTDLKFRKKGIGLLLNRLEARHAGNFSNVDLGAGPGKMTQLLNQEAADAPFSLLLDALTPMLLRARARNPGADAVLGVYEAIPLASNSLDTAMAGFAIRDAKNLKVAFAEVHRVLKPGGLLLFVDLTKPDAAWKRTVLGFYWRVLAPALAFLAAGRLGLKFGALSTTFRRLPTSSQFLSMLQDCGFVQLEVLLSMLGGVGIFLFSKKGEP